MKKYVGHFNRGIVIGFEIVGVLVLVVFAAWLLLIVRLSQGPLDASFLTKSIEKEISGQETGFMFSAGSTLLIWGGAQEPFEFEMKDVQISRADKTPVLLVKKIRVQLSKRYLVFGRFVPRVIKIYAPVLKLIRDEDGRFHLNMGGDPPPAEQKPEAAVAPVPATDTESFIENLLARMKDGGAFGLLSGLEQISITEAAFSYEDKALNLSFHSKGSEIIFTQRKGGLMVDSITDLDLGEKKTTYVRGSFYYSWQTHRPNGVIHFTDLNPSVLAKDSEPLKNMAGIDMPLKGSIAIEMDQDFRIGPGRFVLGADAGAFTVSDLYAVPLPVKSFYVQGRFNIAGKEALLEEFRADLGGSLIEASADIRRQDEGRVIRLKAVLEKMPMDSLKKFWPEKLAPDARKWVTGNLSAGAAKKATLNLALLSPKDDFQNLRVLKLGGDIDFSGIRVNYFSPLMPVTDVAGKALYDQKSFTLDITGGKLGDMQVTKSKINITGLDVIDDKNHAVIDIAATLNGPLPTALKVLESDPLGYPKKLGLVTEGATGNAAVDVGFKFPLYDKLSLPEVHVTARAKLDDVRLEKLVSGLGLSGGVLDVSLDGSTLKIGGAGQLDGMPVRFKWLRNFHEKADPSLTLDASLSLTPSALEAFGLPAGFAVSGIVPADISYMESSGHAATMSLKGDITPAAFIVPVSGYEKKAGVQGVFSMNLSFGKNGKLSKISDLNMTSADALLKGNIEFGEDGKSLRRAVFSNVKMDRTDISLAVDRRGENGYVVDISGGQMDVSKELAGDKKAGEPVPSFALTMNVNKLVTAKDGRNIQKVRLVMHRNGWGRIEQMEMDGISGEKPLRLRYMPVAGGHTLDFEADNAGTALSAFGITNGMRDGKVIVTGRPTPNGGPRDIGGVVAVSDFTLVNIPALGRLLNAMSLTGIVELLNGKGISFKKAGAIFQWTDKGPPGSGKNVRLIHIKDGQTSGASLGLTFEGNIDDWAHILDLSGTIIPVSDINKLLGIIPLVGDILTGGGGVFAATYTIKGPTDQPTVTVNPLSVLAPGILRKLFFEK